MKETYLQPEEKPDIGWICILCNKLIYYDEDHTVKKYHTDCYTNYVLVAKEDLEKCRFRLMTILNESDKLDITAIISIVSFIIKEIKKYLKEVGK